MKYLIALISLSLLQGSYAFSQEAAPALLPPETAAEPTPAPSEDSVGLGKFLFNKGLEVAQHSKPSMFRDFVNNEWLYGALFEFYRSKEMLPKLVPEKYRGKLSLPAVSFGAGLMAPVSTSQGTPVIEASFDLTAPLKQALLLGISKLPANLNQHLSVVTDVLKTDGEGSGILSLGGAGGRDFNKGVWRAGLSMHLAIKFGSNSTRDTANPDATDRLLSPGSDSPTQ